MGEKPVWQRIKEVLKDEIEKDMGEPYFINGESVVHLLLKDGTLLSLIINDVPDEETIEAIFE